MRLQGLPEPVILDVLANELDPDSRQARRPEDRDGVRVVAAKLLLDISAASGTGGELCDSLDPV